LGWKVTHKIEATPPDHPFGVLTLKNEKGVQFTISPENVILDPATDEMTIWDFN